MGNIYAFWSRVLIGMIKFFFQIDGKPNCEKLLSEIVSVGYKDRCLRVVLEVEDIKFSF